MKPPKTECKFKVFGLKNVHKTSERALHVDTAR